MCYLTENLEQESFDGYKVVAEKDKKNYSLAMGFCYDSYNEVPIVEKQKRISYYYNGEILEDSLSGYSDLMKGRTAVFVNLQKARDYAKNLSYESFDENFSLKIKKATVSKDLMGGKVTKRFNSPEVVAGRKIVFHRTIAVID